ncbi:PqqD family protein [Blautia sp. AM16-16B]|nr:PqqD family protein [Blautia sp. AM16-16B]
MKIKSGFVLREVAGKAVVIAVGEASKSFHGMINLNSTGKVIWQGVDKGLSEEEITSLIVDTFDVDVQTAQSGVHRMIGQMQDAGVIE